MNKSGEFLHEGAIFITFSQKTSTHHSDEV